MLQPLLSLISWPFWLPFLQLLLRLSALKRSLSQDASALFLFAFVQAPATLSYLSLHALTASPTPSAFVLPHGQPRAVYAQPPFATKAYPFQAVFVSLSARALHPSMPTKVVSIPL